MNEFEFVDQKKIEEAFNRGIEYEREVFRQKEQVQKKDLRKSYFKTSAIIIFFIILPTLTFMFNYEKSEIVFGDNGNVNLLVKTHLGLKSEEYKLRYNREESYWEVQSTNGEWQVLLDSFGEPVFG